jgi:D-amino-acid oxidase
MTKITVIGSGVSGLSCAVNLQDAGFEVTIITRDMPQSTTSMAAGAVWYGDGMIGKPREWATATLKHFQELSHNEKSGVQIARLQEVYSYRIPDPWFVDLLPYFARIPADELPQGADDGVVMDVPIVNSPRYLQFLTDQFLANKGTFEVREISTLQDLKQDYHLIVNCTGVWAKHVADDPSVYPIRGQTIVIDAPDIKQGYMYDFTYLFPRQDGVLIGGIADVNNWDLTVDETVTSDILARCSQIESSVTDATIKNQFVGLRPGRNQVRLEVESLSEQCTVIHNYGHSGVGYTLSWGCALDVTSLAKSLA